MKFLVTAILINLVFLGYVTTAYAAAEVKEVCHDKVDKAGKPVMKDGQPVKECKKIKVHKKLEGTEIPPAKK